MREILFRGKDKDGNWHEGDLIHGVGYKKGNMYILPIVENLAYIPNCHQIDGVKVIPETIGQFTALTDKNGVKIFEGDVVAGGNVLCNGGFNIINDKCTVIFKSGMFKCGSMSLITFSNRCVVVGNIHENQELLNQ